MANHKSALKRIRQTKTRRIENRYYAKTARNAIKDLRKTTDKAEAEKKFVELTSLLDKLVKRNDYHKNKAANLKSKLAKHVNSLS